MKNEWNFLNQPYPTLAKLYLLLKIHKSLIDPPGRPIVSTRGTILEPLSVFIGSYLRPLMIEIPSYIRDSTHFLQVLMQHAHWATEADIVLVTLDVTSLYTNVPQPAAYDSVVTALKGRGDLSDCLLSFLSELTNLTVYQNYFVFENTLYQLISGVAMGATFAPSIANLYMGTYEEKWIKSSPYTDHLKLWCRYINDIFLLWKGLVEFLAWLNNRDNNIQFTHSHHANNVTFLDVLVKRGERGCITSIYRKDTERNTFLHYSSAHPIQLRNSLPFSQFVRYRRNCSEDRDFKHQSKILKYNFQNRGYPKQVINQAYTRALFNNRGFLLHPQKKNVTSSHNINLVTRYFLYSSQIKQIMKKHTNVLNSIPGLEEKIIQCVWQRHKNLKEKLSPAVLRPLSTQQAGNVNGH